MANSILSTSPPTLKPNYFEVIPGYHNKLFFLTQIKSLTSLILTRKKMQIKTPLEIPFFPIRLAKIKMFANTICWQGNIEILKR